MAQLQQVFCQLAHAALIVQTHIIVLFPLIEVAVHKYDRLACRLHQLPALIGLQAHYDQPYGVPRLRNAVGSPPPSERPLAWCSSRGANGVFQRGDHFADKGIGNASFSSRLG